MQALKGGGDVEKRKGERSSTGEPLRFETAKLRCRCVPRSLTCGAGGSGDACERVRFAGGVRYVRT